MQCTVDQRGAGRFTRAHADGFEHRSGSHAANRETTQPGGRACHQKISAEAGKDLTLLESLYNQYRANPSADTLQKIESLIQDTTQSLPALLQAAHVSDPALSARITAGVNLVVTTVNSFASLIPRVSSSALARTARQRTVVPRPQDLKKQWNLQVCAPSGNAALDAALSERGLK